MSESQSVADKAQRLYDEVLKEELEIAHMDSFCAIEPESGDYFLGKTFSEAMGAARKAHPDRPPYCVRIGHRAALHLGVLCQ
jgi:hypothetical protein